MEEKWLFLPQCIFLKPREAPTSLEEDRPNSASPYLPLSRTILTHPSEVARQPGPQTQRGKRCQALPDRSSNKSRTGNL
jgi:hypothetical protein